MLTCSLALTPPFSLKKVYQTVSGSTIITGMPSNTSERWVTKRYGRAGCGSTSRILRLCCTATRAFRPAGLQRSGWFSVEQSLCLLIPCRGRTFLLRSISHTVTPGREEINLAQVRGSSITLDPLYQILHEGSLLLEQCSPPWSPEESQIHRMVWLERALEHLAKYPRFINEKIR